MEFPVTNFTYYITPHLFSSVKEDRRMIPFMKNFLILKLNFLVL